MKKFLFSLSAVISVACGVATAQVSEGGIPLSMSASYNSTNQQYIPQLVFESPDINALEKEDSAKKHTGLFRIGTTVSSDINFATSGTTTTLDNGQKIWRLQIRMPGAQALGLYYDHFYMPQGVKFFLTNANNKQILGAYTSKENPNGGRLATEKVQGEIINLEIDMDANVDPSNIQLHINKIATFYNGIGYLQNYSSLDGAMKTTGTLFPYRGSSACERNAICPEGDSFPDQRKATVHIEYLSGAAVYGGTGIMMTNTSHDCTPYLLTASHVEPTNSTADSTFSQWIFYFNYETPTCSYIGRQPNTTQTMTGAYFRARASYDRTNPAIVGDFLLVQLETAIPASYGAYLAGWTLSTTTPTSVIGFHHPSADVKKLSTATTIYPDGDFNGGERDSHWAVDWSLGGEEEGSSGSGLFDQNGRLIGDLSGGAPYNPTCFTTNSSGDTMSNIGLYSKLSLNWEYVYQVPSSSATRLKDWLDPKNTGISSTDAILATPCDTSSTTSVSNQQALTNAINIYPNPTNGVIYANVALNNASNLKIAVYNVLGMKIAEENYANVTSGKYKVDISNNASGIYMITISTDNATVTRKVILSK